MFMKPTFFARRALSRSWALIWGYQIMRYTDLPRAVVLCVEHDLKNPPGHVDILELSALADYLKN
jgi:hypothetical protein